MRLQQTDPAAWHKFPRCSCRPLTGQSGTPDCNQSKMHRSRFVPGALPIHWESVSTPTHKRETGSRSDPQHGACQLNGDTSCPIEKSCHSQFHGGKQVAATCTSCFFLAMRKIQAAETHGRYALARRCEDPGRSMFARSVLSSSIHDFGSGVESWLSHSKAEPCWLGV